MLSSLDPKSTDTLHSNGDCSTNSSSAETKTFIWRLQTRKIRLYGVVDLTPNFFNNNKHFKKEEEKRENYRSPVRLVAAILSRPSEFLLTFGERTSTFCTADI